MLKRFLKTIGLEYEKPKQEQEVKKEVKEEVKQKIKEEKQEKKKEVKEVVGVDFIEWNPPNGRVFTAPVLSEKGRVYLLSQKLRPSEKKAKVIKKLRDDLKGEVNISTKIENIMKEKRVKGYSKRTILYYMEALKV